MKSVVLLILLVIEWCSCTKDTICYNIDGGKRLFTNYVYLQSKPVGEFRVIKTIEVDSLAECVQHCCRLDSCEALSYNQQMCRLIRCSAYDDCRPEKDSSISKEFAYLPVTYDYKINLPVIEHEKPFTNTNLEGKPCELGVPGECGLHQTCKEINEERRTGVCVCVTGFDWKKSKCVQNKKKVHHRHKKPVNNTIPINHKPNFKNHNISHEIFNVTKSNATNFIDNKISKVETTTFTPIHNESLGKLAEKNHLPTKQFTVNAGPNMSVSVVIDKFYLFPIISIHGSVNMHDRKVQYLWSRLPDSLSTGKFVNDSQHKSTLLLMDLVPGKYLFKLTATSERGESSSDSMTLELTQKQDNISLNLVDMKLDIQVSQFTEQKKMNFAIRLCQLIEKFLQFPNCNLEVVSVSSDLENYTLITFYATTKKEGSKDLRIIPSGDMEKVLKQKLLKHKYVIDYAVLKFYSRICYNSCDGHGICCPTTHKCSCTLPWIRNRWLEHKTGESNCSMHIIFIILCFVAAGLLSLLLCMVWKRLMRRCRAVRHSYGNGVLKYQKLDTIDS